MSTAVPNLNASESREPRPRANAKPITWRTVLKPIASLQLTVALFSFALLLVFFGTLAQKTQGLWGVVDRYFWSWFVMVDVQPILEFGKIFFSFVVPKTAQAPSWAAFPFPAGKLIGFLMFANLLAAHATRLKMTWKRSGIWVAHAGILLLFVGEYITREYQIEQNMAIDEGGSSNFAIDTRNYEIAFTDSRDPNSDRVMVVPVNLLNDALKPSLVQRILGGHQKVIRHPDLPVDLQPLTFAKNSELLAPTDPRAGDNRATAGEGTRVVAIPKEEVSGVDQSDKVDFPAAYVRFFKKGTDEEIGVYLLTSRMDDQKLTVDGTPYGVALRNTHYYKPYSLKLTRFDYEQYTGTNTAKNYTSNLILDDPERGVSREVVVSMNNPLRHRGETFYQHQFNQTPVSKQTVLQVVRNPGWILPYIACGMVSVGLLFHFCLTLIRYLSRSPMMNLKSNTGANRKTAMDWAMFFVIPACAIGFACLFMASKAIPRSQPGPMHYREAARLPVVDGGRVKPLDTVARTYLRKISGQEEYVGYGGERYPAIKWMLDSMVSPPNTQGPAWSARVIRIDNDQVQALLQLPRREGSRYSLEEVAPRIKHLQSVIDRVKPRKNAPPKKAPDAIDESVNRFFESSDRDVFGAQALEVAERIEIYTRICQQDLPLILPPSGSLEWRTLPDVANQAEKDSFRYVLKVAGIGPDQLDKLTKEEQQQLSRIIEERTEEEMKKDPFAVAWIEVLRAYKSEKPKEFDDALEKYRKTTEGSTTPAERANANFETFLNEFSPAYYVMYLYIFAFMLAVVSWGLAELPAASRAVRRASFWILVTTFLFHAFALVARMYIMDRWFVVVTNLYSSAVFIGCAAAGVCVLVELIYPLGLATATGAAIGGITAIIAHNLAASGDTLEMMQAVLDTNFWLATHVTTVTLGYCATFAAGVFAIFYVGLGVFTPILKNPATVDVLGIQAPEKVTGKALGQIIYGTICFATLLSFVGTVLGGIWADQSWGRFWGWDPKENGAVLIVIWNVLILHARWCGLIKERGMAVLALGGIAITTWSWFGTNQLGVGLHAYGFSNTLATGCTITWFITLGLVGVGLIPKRFWLSSKTNV